MGGTQSQANTNITDDDIKNSIDNMYLKNKLNNVTTEDGSFENELKNGLLTEKFDFLTEGNFNFTENSNQNSFENELRNALLTENLTDNFTTNSVVNSAVNSNDNSFENELRDALLTENILGGYRNNKYEKYNIENYFNQLKGGAMDNEDNDDNDVNEVNEVNGGNDLEELANVLKNFENTYQNGGAYYNEATSDLTKSQQQYYNMRGGEMNLSDSTEDFGNKVIDDLMEDDDLNNNLSSSPLQEMGDLSDSDSDNMMDVNDVVMDESNDMNVSDVVMDEANDMDESNVSDVVMDESNDMNVSDVDMDVSEDGFSSSSSLNNKSNEVSYSEYSTSVSNNKDDIKILPFYSSETQTESTFQHPYFKSRFN